MPALVPVLTAAPVVAICAQARARVSAFFLRLLLRVLEASVLFRLFRFFGVELDPVSRMVNREGEGEGEGEERVAVQALDRHVGSLWIQRMKAGPEKGVVKAGKGGEERVGGEGGDVEMARMGASGWEKLEEVWEIGEKGFEDVVLGKDGEEIIEGGKEAGKDDAKTNPDRETMPKTHTKSHANANANANPAHASSASNNELRKKQLVPSTFTLPDAKAEDFFHDAPMATGQSTVSEAAYRGQPRPRIRRSDVYASIVQSDPSNSNSKPGSMKTSKISKRALPVPNAVAARISLSTARLQEKEAKEAQRKDIKAELGAKKKAKEELTNESIQKSNEKVDLGVGSVKKRSMASSPYKQDVEAQKRLLADIRRQGERKFTGEKAEVEEAVKMVLARTRAGRMMGLDEKHHAHDGHDHSSDEFRDVHSRSQHAGNGADAPARPATQVPIPDELLPLPGADSHAFPRHSAAHFSNTLDHPASSSFMLHSQGAPTDLGICAIVLLWIAVIVLIMRLKGTCEAEWDASRGVWRRRGRTRRGSRDGRDDVGRLAAGGGEGAVGWMKGWKRAGWRVDVEKLAGMV